jgi:hypothetical protein
MQTVSDLRKVLTEIFEELQKDEINTNKARELARVAGKILSSAKVQLDYQYLRGDKPSIPFLEK